MHVKLSQEVCPHFDSGLVDQRWSSKHFRQQAPCSCGLLPQSLRPVFPHCRQQAILCCVPKARIKKKSFTSKRAEANNVQNCVSSENV